MSQYRCPKSETIITGLRQQSNRIEDPFSKQSYRSTTFSKNLSKKALVFTEKNQMKNDKLRTNNRQYQDQQTKISRFESGDRQNCPSKSASESATRALRDTDLVTTGCTNLATAIFNSNIIIAINAAFNIERSFYF